MITASTSATTIVVLVAYGTEAVDTVATWYVSGFKQRLRCFSLGGSFVFG